MKKKGVSVVIATILLLIIIMGVASVSYLYFSGKFFEDSWIIIGCSNETLSMAFTFELKEEGVFCFVNETLTQKAIEVDYPYTIYTCVKQTCKEALSSTCKETEYTEFIERPCKLGERFCDDELCRTYALCKYEGKFMIEEPKITIKLTCQECRNSITKERMEC